MLAPAEGFYTTDGAGLNEVRVAYVLETDRLKRCIEIIEAGLQAYCT